MSALSATSGILTPAVSTNEAGVYEGADESCRERRKKASDLALCVCVCVYVCVCLCVCVCVCVCMNAHAHLWKMLCLRLMLLCFIPSTEILLNICKLY